MSVTHTTTVRNAIVDLICDTLDSGKLVFRASPSTADSPGTAVATLTLNAAAFPAASSGSATAAAITSDTNAAGGTIAYATLQTSANVVKVHCSVASVSGGDINVSSGGLTVNSGDTVSCSSLVYTGCP